jgi:hypothetical protein
MGYGEMKKCSTELRHTFYVAFRGWLYSQSQRGKLVYPDKTKQKIEITGVRANICANSVTRLQINLRNRTPSPALWFEPYKTTQCLFQEKK